MKKLTLFLALFTSLTALKAQQTCVTAVNIVPTATCNYSTHTTTGTDYWLKFSATSPTVNISLVTVKFDLNATHIHNLALYSGSCSNPVLVADDELPFVEDAKELAIDLNASGLIVGQSYYLKATRLATNTVCDKGACTANGSINPTVFDICVEDIDVIIPLDFGLESPQISHAYTTNRGQLVDISGNLLPGIKLYTINANPQVYLSNDKLHYVFSKTDTSTSTLDTLHRIDMSLVGALPTKVFKTEQTAGLTNYYLGHIPAGVTNNKSYSRAVCNGVYTNIDMQYYSNSEGIKQYFIVKPGGDADDIILKFDGATAINVTQNGGLEIVTSIGTLDFEPPHAYQINNGNNVVPMPWQAKFIQLSANTVKFDIRNYPENMPLFIQVDRGHSQKGPSDPEWSTYFGGSGNDFGYDITNDNNGNIFVIGETRSNNFPVTIGAVQGTNLGGIDAFLSKFDVNYEQNWTTYYGGGGDEIGRAVSYSGFNDKIYISMEINGSPQSPFISTQAANSSSFVSNDVSSTTFLARFNNQFGMREWATYFGGSGTIPTKMAVDNLGNLYVVGYSANYNTPIIGCTAPTGNGNGFSICNANGTSFSQFWGPNGGFTFGDGFIAKFNSATELTWSTFFGGNNDDAIYDVVFDEANQQLIVGGFTSSTRIGSPTCSPNTSMPLCGSGTGVFFQQDLVGVSDGFLSKFNAVDNKLIYSTYFGGAGDDAITGIATTSLGHTFITGFSNTFQNGIPNCATPINVGFPFCPSTPPAYIQNQNGTSFDSFIARLNESNGLEWSTFLGGDKDELLGVANIHSSSKVFITNNNIVVVGNTISGTTGSTIPFPLSNSNTSFFFKSNHGDQAGTITTDTYVSLFNETTNELVYSSYFGGKGTDNIGNVTAFQGRIYITGGTSSNTLFPINCPTSLFPNPFCQQTLQGGSDVFISQIRLEGLVGIEDKIDESSVFSIYPNPTYNSITIKLNDVMLGKDVSIKIYDIIGQLSYSNIFKKQSNNELNINVANLPKGIYLIQVQMEGQNYSTKFVKQ